MGLPLFSLIVMLGVLLVLDSTRSDPSFSVCKKVLESLGARKKLFIYPRAVFLPTKFTYKSEQAISSRLLQLQLAFPNHVFAKPYKSFTRCLLCD